MPNNSETEPLTGQALDDQLTEYAVDLLLAMMRSASTDKIDPRKWWTRAQSALKTGAEIAESWQHLISKMGDKLQIDVTQVVTAKEIYSIGRKLVDQKKWERFQTLCVRDALYITAMAQVKRDEQRI